MKNTFQDNMIRWLGGCIITITIQGLADGRWSGVWKIFWIIVLIVWCWKFIKDGMESED